MAKKSLANLVIVVTGASDGVGRKIAEELGKQKAQVVLVARRKGLLQEIASTITAAGGKALAIPTDLQQGDQVATMISTTLKKFGRIDVLINVAGMSYYDWIEEQTRAELVEQFMTNVVGMLDTIRLVVPIMKKQRSGHIINFASYASQISIPPLSIYASTKYAVEGLSDGLRRELTPWNIKVTRVHPSAVNTGFNKKAARHKGLTYPYDKITGVTMDDVAQAVINAIHHPKTAVYVTKWKIFFDLVVFFNRYFPGIIDLVFKFRVKEIWRQDKKHDPQV